MNMAKMAPDQGKINKGAEPHLMPRSRSRLGGSHGHGSDVGNETKADVRGVQEGGSAAEARGSVLHTGGLKGATEELHRQHPHHHHDLGPHHGGKEHERHEPLHGMRPGR